MTATVVRELIAKLGFVTDEAGWERADHDIELLKQHMLQLDTATKRTAADYSAAGAKMARSSDAAANASAARSAAAQRRQRDTRGRFGKPGEETAKAAAGAGGSKLLSTLGGALAGLAITDTVKQMVELASNASETDNVLGEVFGPAGMGRVKEWSAQTAAAVGRSRYELQADAGALGAILQPMVGSSAQAEVMSTKFAQLAVDLGSFFNTSDDEALAALKSGITGQSEPLLKYGVVLQDATLAEFAHQQGISKKLSEMSNAEKTSLRYAFILAKTSKAQGDAARTSDGFANMLKRSQARMKDLGTAIGARVLPYALKLLTSLGKLTDYFGDMVENAHGAEAAIVSLGIVLAIVFGPALATGAALAALFAGLVVTVNDLFKLFNGEQSTIGDWLDAAFGDGTAKAVVDSIKSSVEGLVAEMEKLLHTADRMPGWLIEAAKGAKKEIKEKGFWKTVLGDKKERSDPLADLNPEERAREQGAAAVRGARFNRARAKRLERERNDAFVADQAARAADADDQAAAEQDVENAYRRMGKSSALSTPAVTAPAPAPAAAAGNNVTMGDTIVNFNGPVTNPADAARGARQAAELERRRTLGVLTRPGSSRPSP